MASAFNLTAQLNLKGPTNVGAITSSIKKQLGSFTANVDLKINSSSAKNVAQLNSGLQQLNKTLSATTVTASSAANALAQLGQTVGAINIKNLPQQLAASSSAITQISSGSSQATKQIAAVTTQMEEFGKQSALAVRRFAAFSIVTSSIYALSDSINKGIAAFIEYDQQFVKLQQVTGQSAQGLQSLSKEITSLSVGFGVSSSALTEVASTLAQAGLSAKDTERALKALALSSLAPSFDSMNETVEGSIALMRQFGISAEGLEGALSSINTVAAKFAVEASDIITAVQRTGGVFATASKGVSEGADALNEFIAVFTSVRATTRESAETIATGLRTIFTRIQRGSTIDALKEFGVNLQDAEGKFVGAYKAVELLSKGLNGLDTRDVKFSKIVEELGGFRQIGKVIPLIQQFSVAQNALKIAQQGQGSLAKDAATAQLSLGNQIQKVRQEFLALFREIGQSQGFQIMVKATLSLASALIKVADASKVLLPALGVLLAFKGASAVTQFASGFGQGLKPGAGKKDKEKPLFAQGGQVRAFARGGVVPGSGDGDTVPAMLTPGEFVIRKKAVKAIGAQNLHRMNKYAEGGKVQKYADGGRAKIANIQDVTVQDGDTFDATVTPTGDPFRASFRLWGYDAYETGNKISRISPNRFKDIKRYNTRSGALSQIDGNTNPILIPPFTGVKSKTTASKAADEATEKLSSGLKNFDNKTLVSKINENLSTDGKFGRYAVNLGKLIPDELTTGRYEAKNSGGVIQKFLKGGTVEETAEMENLSLQDAILAQIKELGGIGGVKKLIGTSGSDRTLDSLLRANVIKQKDAIDPKALKAVNDALSNEEGKQIRRAQQINKSQKLAVVGLQPFDKSEEIPLNLPGFEDSTIFVRGLSSKYAEAVAGMRQMVENTIEKFGTDIQNTMVFGGNAPLALDFDETLVSGADIFGPDGKPDIPAYSDLNKVASSLQGGQLTSLGEKIKEIIGFDPSFINRIRVLTARPQSNDQLLSQKLNELGIPLGPDKITGVSGGNKGTSMGVAERLIDDNIKNINDAKKAGKSAVQYSELRRLSEEEKAATGNANAEGAILEAALAKMGAVGGSVQNRAVDFENGLGMSAAQAFPGIAPDWPTEVKRTLSSDNIGRAKEEFTRYYAENYGPWPQQEDAFGFDKAGRPVSRFAQGGKASRKVSYEAGVGPSPFASAVSKTLGQSVYALQNGTGLSDQEFNEIKKTADTYGYNEEEFKQYLAKRIQEKKNKSGLRRDPSALLRDITPQSRTSTARQLALAETLKGPPDAGYRPILTEAQRIAQARSDISNATRYAVGGVAEPEEKKKEKEYGYTGLYSDASAITAMYLGNKNRTGSASAYKFRDNLYYMGMSSATGGYGPRLYDLVMEAATEQGSMLTSDRNIVSPSAKRVWEYYFNNRSDVNKTQLDPKDWTMNQAMIDPALQGDKSTWPPATDPAWVLQSGYSKSPSLIKDPSVKRLSKEQKSIIDRMSISGFMRATIGNREKFAGGGPVSLYHGSNTGVNDNVLKSFKENGALSNIAQGYGQGAGFYLWSDKDSAKRQAEMRVKGGLGSFTTVSGDTAGKPMVLTFKEMLDPATWDLDYELNKGPVVNWLYKNFDKIKDKVVPQRANSEAGSTGLTGIKDIISADNAKGIMSNGIRVQSDSGSRLSIYAGTEANLREGEMLGQIMSRLQSSDPKMVGDFENEFFNSPSLSSGDWTNLALKYVGSSPLKPTNIETFAKGGSVEDTVPALLTPGEFVVNKQAAQKIGYSKLHQLNHADKIAGFNKGGVVGGVQTFAAGGTVSFSGIMEKIIDLMKTDSRPGPAPKLVSRPDTPSRATLQISDGVQGSIKEVIKALNDLGVSSSNTADLINKGGDLSYKITEKALAKDIERMKLAGATIDQIAAAEKVLAEVRSESKTKVGQTQKLEDSFRNSSVGQKFGSGGAQQAIILEADKIEKSLQQQNVNLIASKLQMPGATPAEIQAKARELANDPAEKAKIKERAYFRAAENVTGVKKSEFTKLGISGGDIQKYISESLKDRKSLANMDKLLIEAKIQELKNTTTYQSALGSEQERMLAEVKAAAEEEASVRREIINDLARNSGGEGVGAAGLTDWRNSPIVQALKRNMPQTVGEGIGMAATGGVFASGFIAANGNNIANQLYDTTSNKGALQAAKTGAAISSGGTIASAGFTAASQSLQVDPSGATAAIIALGTAAVIVTDSLYDFTGSQKAATEALEQSIRAEQIAQATSSLELAFRKFENDVGNINIQKSLNEALSNAIAASASGTSFNIRQSEEEFNVNNRGIRGFFAQKIFGEENVVMDARQREAVNAQEAERYGQAANMGYQQIGESIKGGASVDQIMKDSNLAGARRAIVMSSAAGVGEYTTKAKDRAQELGLSRGEDLSQKEQEAIMDEIAARVVAEDSYITTSVKATKLALALEAADLAGRRIAQSFDKLFDSISQAINKNNFNIEQRKSATEYAMGALSGNAVSPEYNSRNINILQNPKAYSSEEFQGALNTASQGLSPADSAMIKGAATIQRDLAPAIEASIRGAITGGPGRAGKASLKIEEAADIARTTGFAQIDSLAGVPEELKATIKQQLDAAINAQAGSDDVQNEFKYDNASAVDKFLATIKDATDKALNNAGKGATDALIQNETARQQAFNEFTKNLARSSALLKSYNDTLNKAKKVVDDSRLNVKQAITGRSESFTEMKGRLNADTARLTGGLTDPTAIGKQILSLQQRGSALQSQIKQANDSRETEKAAKFAQELDKINSQINSSSQALENMANSGDLAAKALDGIADRKALLQSRTNVTESLLTQSPEEAKKRNDTFLRLQNNANGGMNGAINSREARLAYSEAMRSGKGPQGAYRAANTVLSQQRSETLDMLKNPDFKNMMIMQSMQNQEKALGRKLNPDSEKDQEIYAKQKIEAERQYAEYEYNVKNSMAQETGQSNNPLMMAELKTLKDRASGNFTSGYEMEVAAAKKAAEIQSQALNAQAKLIESQQALINPLTELKASLDGLRTAIAGARGEDAKVESGSAAAAVAAGKGVAVGVAPAGGVAPAVKARGGVVYADKGALINFEPKGTDTVPAMLTPGEFVVNARATQQHLPLLQAINKSKGGVVYLATGGMSEQTYVPKQPKPYISKVPINEELAQQAHDLNKPELEEQQRTFNYNKTEKMFHDLHEGTQRVFGGNNEVWRKDGEGQNILTPMRLQQDTLPGQIQNYYDMNVKPSQDKTKGRTGHTRYNEQYDKLFDPNRPMPGPPGPIFNKPAGDPNAPPLFKNKGGVIYASVGGLLEKAQSIWKGVTNAFGFSESVSDVQNKGATAQNITSSATSAANITEAGLELAGRNVPGVSVVANTLDAGSNFANAVSNPDASLTERTGNVLAGTSSALNAAKSAQDARNLATAATTASSATTGASGYSSAAGPINVGATLVLGAAAGLADERENADIGTPGRIVAGALTGSAGTGGEGLSRDLAENLTSGNTENIQEGLEQQGAGLRGGASLGFLGPAGFAAGYGIGTAAYTAKVANQAVQQAYEADREGAILDKKLDRATGRNGTPVPPLSLSSEPTSPEPSTVTSSINNGTSNQPPKPSPSPELTTNDGTLSVNSNQPPKPRLTMSKGGLIYLATGGQLTPEQIKQAKQAQKQAQIEAKKESLRQRKAAYEAQKQAQRKRNEKLREGYSVAEANAAAAEQFPQAFASIYSEMRQAEEVQKEIIRLRKEVLEEEKRRKLNDKENSEDLLSRYDGQPTAAERRKAEIQADIDLRTANQIGVTDKNGQPVIDPITGKPVMEMDFSATQNLMNVYSKRAKGDEFRDTLNSRDKALLDKELARRRELKIQRQVQKDSEDSRARFEKQYAEQQEKEKARVANLEQARNGKDFLVKGKDGKSLSGSVISNNNGSVVIRQPNGLTQLVSLQALEEDSIKAINAQTSYQEQQKREAEAPKVAANKPTVDYVAEGDAQRAARDAKNEEATRKSLEESKRRNDAREAQQKKVTEGTQESRNRLLTIVRLEQQNIDRLEKKKKDSGWFGSLTGFVTGDTTDDQQIQTSRQKISSARLGLDSLEDFESIGAARSTASSLPMIDLSRSSARNVNNTLSDKGGFAVNEGADQRSLNLGRSLAGLPQIDVKTGELLDNGPTGPGLFRTDIRAGQRYLKQEEAAINTTRDTAIGVTLAVAAPIAAAAIPGAAATTYTGAALSSAASAATWTFAGSATRNLDQVRSGEKTTQQGVIDTSFDTMAAATFGAGLGMVSYGAGEVLKSRASNIAKEARRVAQEEYQISRALGEASDADRLLAAQQRASATPLQDPLMANAADVLKKQQVAARQAARAQQVAARQAAQADRLSTPRYLVDQLKNLPEEGATASRAAQAVTPRPQAVSGESSSPFASNAPNVFNEAATSSAAQAATPAAQVATPAAQVATPAAQVATPAAQVATPAAQVATPAANPRPQIDLGGDDFILLPQATPQVSTPTPPTGRSWAQFLRSQLTFRNALTVAGPALPTAGTALYNIFANKKKKQNQGPTQTNLPPISNRKPLGRSSGGIIYAANGALMSAQAKGTDTVPAMLTPGEFVVNRESTKQYLPLLKSINSGNYASGGLTKYMAQGGVVTPQYKAVGGETSGGSQYSKTPLSTKGSTEDARLDKIEKSMDKFVGIATTFERASESMGNNINQFSQAVTTMPTQMSHSLNAVVNGSISNSTGAATQIVNSRHEAQIVVDQNNQRMDRANEGAFSRSDPTIIRGSSGAGGSAHA